MFHVKQSKKVSRGTFLCIIVSRGTIKNTVSVFTNTKKSVIIDL